MKNRYLVALMATLLGLGIYAQSEEATPAPSQPQLGERVEKLEKELGDRVKALENRIRISGYLAYSGLFNLDAFQIGAYDASPENTRFRFNFDYTSGDFGLRARLHYRLAQTSISQYLNGGMIDLEYASAYAQLWKKAFRVTGGRTRITGDYNVFFYGAGDNIGFGNYSGGRASEGFEFQLKPIQVLSNLQVLDKAPVDVGLGVFLPWKLDTSTGVDGAWLASGDRVDVNFFVDVKDLGLKFVGGWLYGDDIKNSFLTSASFPVGFGNYFGSDEKSGFNVTHVGVNITKDFFGLVKGLKMGLQYGVAFRGDNFSVRAQDLNATLGFTWEGLAFGIDVLSKFFNTGYEIPNWPTKPYEKYDDNALYIDGYVSYLFKGLLFGYDFKPALDFTYETARDASGATAPADKFRLYPSIRLIEGRNEIRLGYVADFNTSKIGADMDIDGAITFGMTVNY